MKFIRYELCSVDLLADAMHCTKHDGAGTPKTLDRTNTTRWQLLAILYLGWRETADEEVWAGGGVGDDGDDVRKDQDLWTPTTSTKARAILELEMWRLAWKRLRQEDGAEMSGVDPERCTHEILAGRRWAWKQLIVLVYGAWDDTMREHAWTLAQVLRCVLGYLRPVGIGDHNSLRDSVFWGTCDFAHHPGVFSSLLCHLNARINDTERLYSCLSLVRGISASKLATIYSILASPNTLAALLNLSLSSSSSSWWL